MKEGDLVTCLETGRVGVLLELQRASWSTLALVRWPDGESWTDVLDIEVVGQP